MQVRKNVDECFPVAHQPYGAPGALKFRDFKLWLGNRKLVYMSRRA